MLTKPKYKVCKRLGNGVYEKCQTQKFALSEARAKKTFRRRRNVSDYGRQLLEKQKVRYAYGITEKQLRNYVATATTTKSPTNTLHKLLEMRLDNAIYRLGFAATRRAARQIVNHGHVTVSGRKMNIPSYSLDVDDTIAVRDRSKDKPLFTNRMDDITGVTPPKWLTVDAKKLSATVKSIPELVVSDTIFDLKSVFEFYNR